MRLVKLSRLDSKSLGFPLKSSISTRLPCFRRGPRVLRGAKEVAHFACQTPHITSISRLTDYEWTTLVQLASLLSAAFYEGEEYGYVGTPPGDDNYPRPHQPNYPLIHPEGMAAAAFGWTSLMAVLLQHMIYGNQHVTFFAVQGDQLIGCCGLSMESAPPPDVLAATDAATNDMPYAYGLVNGLAVDPAHRRRGVATQLLQAAADTACSRLGPHTLLALLVAKTNVAARRLYDRQGFMEQPTWTDERWREEAERGKVGKPRRLLLVKAGAVEGERPNTAC